MSRDDGKSPIVGAGVDELIATAHAQGRLTASVAASAVEVRNGLFMEMRLSARVEERRIGAPQRCRWETGVPEVDGSVRGQTLASAGRQIRLRQGHAHR